MSEAPLFVPRRGWRRPDPRRVAALGFAASLAVAVASLAVPLPLRAPRLLPVPGSAIADLGERAERAQRAMGQARDFIRSAKIRAMGAGALADPSGLVGQEVTPLVTTLGSLEAKRLSTSPVWARVLTERLGAEGVGPGSVVAASLSGSFPGLNLALAAACDALGVRLIAVSSVTASTWGANEPGFTWPEMEAMLVEGGVIRPASVAIAAGGAADAAADLAGEDRALASRIRNAAAARLGVPALRPGSFEEAVGLRLRAYRRAAAGAPVALYVNVGGAEASMGHSPAILGVGTGFVTGRALRGTRGVTAWFAEQGVPILMLLNVRELALRWGVGL